ncbi:MAG: hypothetical protein AAF333_10530 [Planctomycetota bacterium]
MSLAGFIRTLHHEGVARVPVIRNEAEFRHDTETQSLVAQGELADVVDALVSGERLIRPDWPGSPPPFDHRVAVIASVFLYQAARLVLSRQVPEAITEKILSAHPIAESSASAHYSVDVVGRYLPDLVLLAGGPMSDDSVVKCLKQFGARWPLSSVGAAGITPTADRLDVILNNAALRAAYVDRVLSRSDMDRLSDERVAEAARLSVGPHTDLVSASISAVLWSATKHPVAP